MSGQAGNSIPDEGLPLIDVTPEMEEAGLVELRDHSLADDLGYVLRCVYRAMEYERLERYTTR